MQPQVLTKQGSASFTVYLRLYMPVTGKTMVILFACSPERNGSTHIFKLVARNDSEGSAEMIAKMIVDEDLILVEDLRVLEAYTEMVLHLDLRAEVHTKADRLSVAEAAPGRHGRPRRRAGGDGAARGRRRRPRRGQRLTEDGRPGGSCAPVRAGGVRRW